MTGARVRRLVTVALVIGAAFYGVSALVLWAFQDRFIFHPSTQVVAPTLPYVSVVEVPTSDGETLIGWSAEAEPGCPTILFLDGNAGRPEIQTERWRRLHEAGFGFLGLYWRGYSGSSGAPSETGFHADARAGLDWLASQGIPASQIVVHGFSIGTGPATRLAAENEIGALILEAPYFSMADLVSAKAPLLPTGLLLRSTFRTHTWIGQVAEPVLIVHGSADSVIPEAEGKRLFEKANQPKVFVSIPDSDHATLVRDGLYDHVWRFLARHLTSQAQSCPSLRRQLETAERA